MRRSKGLTAMPKDKEKYTNKDSLTPFLSGIAIEQVPWAVKERDSQFRELRRILHLDANTELEIEGRRNGVREVDTFSAFQRWESSNTGAPRFLGYAYSSRMTIGEISNAFDGGRFGTKFESQKELVKEVFLRQLLSRKKFPSGYARVIMITPLMEWLLRHVAQALGLDWLLLEE